LAIKAFEPLGEVAVELLTRQSVTCARVGNFDAVDASHFVGNLPYLLSRRIQVTRKAEELVIRSVKFFLQ